MSRDDFALFNYTLTFPVSLNNGFTFNDDLIKKFCDDVSSFYAFILHDLDKSEYKHYHIVLILKAKAKKMRLMDLFKNYFELDSLDSIEFERCSSIVMMLRYLIHYDEDPKEKYQYMPFDVITNNEYRFTSALKYTEDLDIDFLCSLVKKYRTASGVMRVIGLEKYKKYRNVIKDLLDEIFIL